jgi:hypothetical protein
LCLSERSGFTADLPTPLEGGLPDTEFGRTLAIGIL